MHPSRRRDYVRPIDFKRGRVEMIHGNGGKAMAQLIDELFVEAFDNPWLRELNDQARVELPPGRVVVATDTHVITPLFFPGGDIATSLTVPCTARDPMLPPGKKSGRITNESVENARFPT